MINDVILRCVNLMTFITGSNNVGIGTVFVTLQIYTYCTYYFGEDYLVVKTWTLGQYDI